MKRLLLTTIARPLGKSEGTCSENILAERMRDEERLEHLVNGLFQREYEELGPSVCRVLEVQLMGYHTLTGHPDPLFRARAREHKRLCIDTYPLLKTAIRQAPSQKVSEYLHDLKERVQEEFKIPYLTKTIQSLVPALAFYTGLKDRILPNPQPRTSINRYRA